MREDIDACEYGDCGRCKSCMEYYAEMQGARDGQEAALKAGGTKGAEWNADELGLRGSARKAYIFAFENEKIGRAHV